MTRPPHSVEAGGLILFGDLYGLVCGRHDLPWNTDFYFH
jgi:hypothetical protein